MRTSSFLSALAAMSALVVAVPGFAAVSLDASGSQDTVMKVVYTGGSSGGVGVYGKGNPAIYAEAASSYGTTGMEAHAAVGAYNIAMGGYAYGNYSTENYGVYGSATTGQNNYGIYGYAASSSGQNWAGYFNGNVAITGVCSPCTISDEKFKKNIVDLEGGLSKVMALRPKSYEMRANEFKDVANLSEGRQQGFLAQDLESVMPEIVHPIAAPAVLTAEEKQRGVKKEAVIYKGVNYAAMIPTLVKAIQEQQAEIDELRQRLDAR